MKVNVIAEIGINYAFGEDQTLFRENAKRLIDIAAAAGCNFAKLQKRTPKICVPDHQKEKEKKVPWRKDPTTYLQYKEDVEFSRSELYDLTKYADDHGIELFTSVWDVVSAEQMAEVGHRVAKIPSALLTDDQLLAAVHKNFEFSILSTGMSTQEEIDRAVDILDPDVIMHTNSVYPTPIEDLNLSYLTYLSERFTLDPPNTFNPMIGYSSHYYGIADVLPAMALGATWIEKHITLDHTLWGSDQSASLEPHGLFEMMKKIRDMEKAFGGYGPRTVFPGEEEKRKSLRGT